MTSQGAASSSSYSSVHASWPNILQLRIALIGVTPPIWRLLQVPDDYAFFGLHSAIQDAIGWGSHYCYRFDHFTRNPKVASIGLPFKGHVPSYEHDFHIGPFFVDPGDIVMYSADRLDSRWRFQILFEKAVLSIEGVTYPRCVDGQRGCPPEGIGSQEFQHHMHVASDTYNPMQQNSIGYLTSMGYSDEFNPQSVVFKDPKVLFRSNY